MLAADWRGGLDKGLSPVSTRKTIIEIVSLDSVNFCCISSL